MEVSGRFIEEETLLVLNFVWPHSLKLDIGQRFDDSYLGLAITHSQPFRNIIFVNIILLSFCMISVVRPKHIHKYILKSLFTATKGILSNPQ